MIIAVPEVVSQLLLRYKPEKGQNDVGIFDILNGFEHIVFDEFHTISPRGFGLAGLFAKMTAEYSSSRAKVTFLSATPLDIASVLQRLEVPEQEIVHIHEELVLDGRVVHGDVRLSLHQEVSMIDLVKDRMAEIQKEVARGRQVVVIYNALSDLQRHLAPLEQIFREKGIEAGQTLVIDSIDDSRVQQKEGGFFAFGRHQDPEKFKILIATASVEMGVTFNADLLIMEPGFEPMNFLQRYGRAARGDHDGHVIVRFDDGILNKQNWFRSVKKWVEIKQGQRVGILELTHILTESYQKRFQNCSEDVSKHFGRLPIRAAYSAGLYWNVLMGHFSNRGHRWKRFHDLQPQPAKQVYRLLAKVREMTSDCIFRDSVGEWCNRFEHEARTLRDIGKGIRVVEEDGAACYVQELWLRRNTDILDRFPLVVAEDGVEEIRIRGTLQKNLLEKKRFIQTVRNARFPQTSYVIPIKDDSRLIANWCREFKEISGRECLAWKLYPESMGAAELLVKLTGLVVSDDMELVASCGIL